MNQTSPLAPIPGAPKIGGKIKSSPFSPVDREHKPVTWCFGCFKPMERKEIAMTVRDKEAVIWDARQKIDLLIHLCPTCTAAREEVANGGIAEAKRRYDLMNINR